MSKEDLKQHNRALDFCEELHSRGLYPNRVGVCENGDIVAHFNHVNPKKQIHVMITLSGEDLMWSVAVRGLAQRFQEFTREDFPKIAERTEFWIGLEVEC